MGKIIFSIVAAICLTSCASTPRLAFKNGASFQTLNIFLEPSPGVIPEVWQGFNRQLDDFILRHNASHKKSFLLARSTNANVATLRIKLIATQLVSSQKQTTGVVVTLIGLSLPVIMASAGAEFFLFFYYFPDVRSMTEVSLSQDIDASAAKPLGMILASPGFLKSPGRQVNKHVIYFDKFLNKLIRQLSKEYVKKKATVSSSLPVN
ncbi:MAG TPA: hypothetical protein VD884_04025 [Ohtaekwangia sp.]|nr:hypothetical protein [Ohtaekwangia sp.]